MKTIACVGLVGLVVCAVGVGILWWVADQQFPDNLP